MADIANLEKLGRELKCPICLSLLNTANSIPCNHVFCNTCILTSMKLASCCPVCKIPFHKRELRAAPHMDNLVNIFKSMEAATGNPVVSTQLASSTKRPDKESDTDQTKKKNTYPERKKKQKSPSQLKPRFPAKKRVHVMPFDSSETPVRPAKVSKLSGSNNNTTDDKDEGDKLAANLQNSLSLRPFFCLGEEEGEEIENFVSLSNSSPLNAPCFSDLKDTQDEVPSKTTPNSKAKGTENFDSEIFEWTQRPCSPELCSTPVKKIKGKKYLDQIQEEGPAPIDKITALIDETQLTSDTREGKSKKKKRRNNNASEERICKRRINKIRERGSKERAKSSTDKKAAQSRKKNHNGDPEKATNSIILEAKDLIEEKEINKKEYKTKFKRINKCGVSNFTLNRCGSAPSRVILCAFCRSADITEVSGEMVHYLNGVPTDPDHCKDSAIVHSHKNCLEWAPDVYFEGDMAVNLVAELARSKRIKCSCCGIKGAALGCLESSCRKSFHFTCAKLVPECRWDNENFVMLCPLHHDSKLPMELSEPQKQISKRRAPKEVSSRSSAKILASKSGKEWSWLSGSPCKWVLTCSSLSAEEKGLVSEFSRLIGAPISSSWSQNVTHVITSTNEAGACKRTLKYLMAILSGKWILTLDWIKACMDAREPVSEEKFEVIVDVHGIRDGPRLGRLKASKKEPRLFNGMEFYLSGDYTMSYRGFIQDLIVTAGGSILQRKPVSRDQHRLLVDLYEILIIYSIEHCEKQEKSIEKKLSEAKALANTSGGKVASSAWIIDSIAACKLQKLA
ncbi:Protein BREAST CANCER SUSCEPTIBILITY 1-like protein [Rhynchospora pubera]|uniref:Protein BREAST CANCER SUSCEPTIBILITY 1-like protein n=1 Tax=Rhynchospora pubera TaxID=906938 RepID=A0AAV8CFE8_9POAL|nr:Protein BREAST CANCER SUSCEPTIBILITY 1-like protein [Rhynchospora pubera]